MKNALIFLGGAALGSLLTWKIVEKKYKDLADAEIKSVVDAFKKKDHTENEDELQEEVVNQYVEIVNEKEEIRKEYSNTISNCGYSTQDNKDDNNATENYGFKPYVIAPEEFGNIDGYNAVSWMYYADGVLLDEMDQMVDDPEYIIGDALKHFGDFGDNLVHVRNENTKCDYEIIKSDMAFDEVE